MKSHEVIRAAVDEPGVKAVAAALHVSPALVYKWCEPSADGADPDASGAKNPLDRVGELYHLTGDVRLIRWLCRAAGGSFVPDPPPARTQTAPARSIPAGVLAHTQVMVREFSELLDAVTASVAHGDAIDPDEADLIRGRWDDLKACGEPFVRDCERGTYHPPLARP